MTLPLRKCPERLAETEIDDEVVLMELDSGTFLSLTGSALAIWRLIDGRRDRAAIAACLAEDYDADPAVLRADLDAFIDQACAAGHLAEG